MAENMRTGQQKESIKLNKMENTENTLRIEGGRISLSKRIKKLLIRKPALDLELKAEYQGVQFYGIGSFGCGGECQSPYRTDIYIERKDRKILPNDLMFLVLTTSPNKGYTARAVKTNFESIDIPNAEVSESADKAIRPALSRLLGYKL